NAGQWTSLKIINGNPAISYYDAGNVRLKYIRANDATGTAWGSPAVLASDGAGRFSSMIPMGTGAGIAYQNS
ncbi:MAG: hypothetical protein IPN95_24020, partial [Bacteroidetes bacterium]|nr:hypothetical protein [Bacteroidota bacterium]